MLLSGPDMYISLQVWLAHSSPSVQIFGNSLLEIGRGIFSPPPASNPCLEWLRASYIEMMQVQFPEKTDDDMSRSRRRTWYSCPCVAVGRADLATADHHRAVPGRDSPSPRLS